MAEITARMVKDLRDRTGAGMMDCKKALVASEGDFDQAIDHLRKSGIAKAAKKAARAANEGLVFAYVSSDVGVLAEVLCETDFVARNDKFQQYATDLVKRVATEGSGDGDVSDAVAEQEKDQLTELIARIGENIKVERVIRWETDGKLASYLHMGGRIGVLAEVKGDVDDDLLNDICMHIAAFSPPYISPDEVPEDVVQKEREIAAAQVEGKPEHIIGRIVDGKMNKWFTENCLTRQPWLRDDKTCLEKLAPTAKVVRFVRWEAGEDVNE